MSPKNKKENDFSLILPTLTPEQQEESWKIAKDELLNAMLKANEKDGSFQEIIELFT